MKRFIAIYFPLMLLVVLLSGAKPVFAVAGSVGECQADSDCTELYATDYVCDLPSHSCFLPSEKICSQKDPCPADQNLTCRVSGADPQTYCLPPVADASPSPTSSATPSPGTDAGGGVSITNPLRFDDVSSLIKAVGVFLFGLGSALLTVFIIWGAYQLMTSGGNPERIKQGRSTITWAAIGFALLLVSGGVGSLVASILGGSQENIENVVDSPINSFEGVVNTINTVARWLFGILIALGTVMILLAAFQYLFSGGDEEKTKKARQALTIAIIAMVVGVMAGSAGLLIKAFFGA